MSLIAYTDGACRGNPGPSSIGIVIHDEINTAYIEEIYEYIGEGTNNEAEYRALIRALERTSDRKEIPIIIRMDSQLVVEQMNGRYKVKNARMIPLFQKAILLTRNRDVKIEYVPREKNQHADALANRALDERK